MRESVHEEVIAANRVAAQLLGRVVAVREAQDLPAVLDFVRGLGRLRSNDISLLDGAGGLLYRSPPSPYKAGRDAPRWFAALVAPWQEARSIDLGGATLRLEANASRAVLDAWDRFSHLLFISAALLAAVNLLVFWVVGRTVRPFARIVEALDELEAGRFDDRAAAAARARGGGDRRSLQPHGRRRSRATWRPSAARRAPSASCPTAAS